MLAPKFPTSLPPTFPVTPNLYTPAACSRSTPSRARHTEAPFGAAASDCQNGISLSVHLPATPESGLVPRTSTSSKLPWLAAGALTRSSVPAPQSYLLQVAAAGLRGPCFFGCPELPPPMLAEKAAAQAATHSMLPRHVE